MNLYRAIDQKGQRCADSDVGCAVNVIGFITCITPLRWPIRVISRLILDESC